MPSEITCAKELNKEVIRPHPKAFKLNC
jgi:hypothetical protein